MQEKIEGKEWEGMKRERNERIEREKFGNGLFAYLFYISLC